MRIFVSYGDESGSRKTTRISLIGCTDTSNFLAQISKKLKIPLKHIIVRLKESPVKLRIISGWPITHYPIKNGSRVQVDYNQKYWSLKSENNSPDILPKIQQVNEIDNDDLQLGQAENKMSFLSEVNGYDYGKYLDQCLDAFLNAVRENNLQKVAKILKQQPQIEDQTEKFKIYQIKSLYLVNEVGLCGRNALHWAIHKHSIDILDFLLIKCSKLSTLTIDGTTPLQLAIQVKFLQGIKTLIDNPYLDIDQLGANGTALHTAVRLEDINTINLLIKKGANINSLDKDDATPIQITNNKKIKQLIQQLYQKRLNKYRICNLLKGKLYKISSISKKQKDRVMMVNPFTGQISLYNSKNELDKKISMKNVVQIQIIKQKSWLMRKQLTYFQIISDQEDVFACKHKIIAHQWVSKIIEAINYNNSETSNKEVKPQDQIIQFINDQNKEITIHKRKVVPKIQRYHNISLMNLPVIQDEEENTITKSNYTRDTTIHQIKIRKDSVDSVFDPQSLNQIQLRQSQIVLGSVLGQSAFNFLPPAQKNIHFDNMSERSSTLSRNQINPESRFSKFEGRRPCFNDFIIYKLLGNGSFGKVFLAKHKRTQKLFALKVLNKKQLNLKKQMKYAIGEVNILKKMDSPFIIKLHYSFQTSQNLYMALDYCPNGDLSQFIFNKEKLPQNLCKFLIAQLILAIQYLHKQNIIYRDLKPENILIRQNGYICLIDFGLSREKNFSMSFCGSPAYLSPEMLEKKGVGKENDIYGIGCVLYQMLVGEPPYFDEDIQKLYENIKLAKLRFPSFITGSAKSIITGLLERNLKKRLGVNDFKQIKNHQFFNGFQWQKLQNEKMKAPTLMNSQVVGDIELNAIQNHGFIDKDYDMTQSMLNKILNFSFSREAEYDLDDMTNEMV